MLASTSISLIDMDFKAKTGFKCSFDYRLQYEFPQSHWGRQWKTKENQSMNQHLCRWTRVPLMESELGFAPFPYRRDHGMKEMLGLKYESQLEGQKARRL